MASYDMWSMLQDCGIWLGFYAFGMFSGVFVAWIDHKVSARHAN
jgi:hypothetical protein